MAQPWVDIQQYYEGLERQARQRMAENELRNPSTLIQVKSQHPLVNGAPGLEFSERLNRALELYRSERDAGRRVEIYVPGSVHVDKKTGIPDEVSLSTAGRQYLIERGVPESDVHGDDLNLEYKGDAGVYGGDDECFVTAQYYKDGQFGTLHVFGSPAQHDRAWERFVGEHGLYPLFHSVPVSDPFHSNAYEVLVAATRMQEGHGKDAQAAEALRLRLERNPSLARGARPAAVSAAQSAAVSPVPGQGRASQLGAARLAARLQRTRGARTKVSTRAAAVRKLAAAQARARGETTRG